MFFKITDKKGKEGYINLSNVEFIRVKEGTNTLQLFTPNSKVAIEVEYINGGEEILDFISGDLN